MKYEMKKIRIWECTKYFWMNKVKMWQEANAVYIHRNTEQETPVETSMQLTEACNNTERRNKPLFRMSRLWPHTLSP